MNEEAKTLINDIRTGEFSKEISDNLRDKIKKYLKANPERADELQKILDEKGHFSFEEIWPNLKIVVCWISGSVGRTSRESKKYFPKDIMYIDWGYGASEGKFTIPVNAEDKRGLPVSFGYFFEFIPLESDNQEPLLLEETQDNKEYELVITSYGGLYRYNMKDIVRVTVGEDGRRYLEFLTKSKDKVRLGDQDLYSFELSDLIEKYENNTNQEIRYFTAKVDGDSLNIFYEPADDSFESELFEQFLNEALSQKNIPNHLEQLEKGYLDKVYQDLFNQGYGINQIKLQVFS